MTTEEGNKLIAGFMNVEYVSRTDSWLFPDPVDSVTDFRAYRSWRTNELQYHTSLDWLVPVIDKIEDIKFSDYETDDDVPFLRTFRKNMVRFNRFCLHEGKTRIEATWKAVVEVIEWHNKQKNG